MTEYKVKKIETCETCNGSGWIGNDPHCSVCGYRITEADFAAMRHKHDLPCEHSFDDLVEEYRCTECEGDGKLTTWVPLEQALQELGLWMPEDWAERAEAESLAKHPQSTAAERFLAQQVP